MFHKGDFKYLILDLLKEKPAHGYEIIRALEDRFHGFYSPSPGAVYPTLQWLEETGYVTSAQQDGKKICTITDEGRRFLAEREKETEGMKDHMHDWWGGWRQEVHEDLREIWQTFGDLGGLIGRTARRAGSEKLRQVREILSNATKEIERILRP
jgi:DNA-binding PadR family transcriptional regulator